MFLKVFFLYFSRSFREYLKKYELKLRLKCQDQELSVNDAKNLELLENNLRLESILDARFYCKERIKVISIFLYSSIPLFGLVWSLLVKIINI
jgi:hypothetical protein